MDDYLIRPATREDIISVRGHLPQYSIRSWAIEYRGEVVCIAGVMYQPFCSLCFSDIIGDIDAPKKKIWRCILEVWEKIKKAEKNLVALCDEKNYPSSSKLLKKLGFEEIDKGVFMWKL